MSSIGQWIVVVAVAGVSWVLSYFAAKSAVNSRLAVLETQINRVERDIVDIKAEITIIRQTRERRR